MNDDKAMEAAARAIWGGDHLLDSDECREVAQAAVRAYLAQREADFAQTLQDHMEQHHGICLRASQWDAVVRAMIAARPQQEVG